MHGAKPYIGSCVELNGDDIWRMMHSAVSIEYTTFRNRFLKDQWAAIVKAFNYARDERYGLTMKDDGHVRYYTAIYKGKEVIVLQHSAIEYIWDDRVSATPNRKLKRQVAA